MSQVDLQAFVDAAKDRGVADEFLASLLTRRGWSTADVYDSLGHWWEQATGIPVPARRSAAENARDAFLYLLAFSTLATWSSALGSLWFQLIDHWLPDTVVNSYAFNFRATVTWQMASILVALPIYLFVMRTILQETRANPERIESGVRKWLTYIALLLAATGVVGDLVCFTGYFLKGELSVRFVLKCITVLAICGSIFWYYLEFLRGRTRSGVYASMALAGAAVAIFCGLSVAGTPAVQRHVEADNRRVEDLRSIASSLYAGQLLPRSLNELHASRPSLRVTDPESGRLYEYTVKTVDTFDLCANFAVASDNRERPYLSDFWSHTPGRTCFSFDRRRQIAW
jgi:hypothetical protein